MKRGRHVDQDEEAAYKLHAECTVMAATFKAYGGERGRLAAMWSNEENARDTSTLTITEPDRRLWVYPFPRLAAEEPSKEETVAELQKAIADNNAEMLDAAVKRARQRSKYYHGLMKQLENRALELGKNKYVQRHAARTVAEYKGHVFVDITPSCQRGGGGENVHNLNPIWIDEYMPNLDTSDSGKYAGYNKQTRQMVFLEKDKVTNIYQVFMIGEYDAPTHLGPPVNIYVAYDPVVQETVASRYM